MKPVTHLDVNQGLSTLAKTHGPSGLTSGHPDGERGVPCQATSMLVPRENSTALAGVGCTWIGTGETARGPWKLSGWGCPMKLHSLRRQTGA